MSTLLTYARAAAPMVPFASRLPFVAGGGGEMPELEEVRNDVEVDRVHLDTYAEVCGFEPRDELPATYPHVLAFGLQMALMTDGRFPFPPVGLVHIANAIEQLRPIDAAERLALRVHTTPAEPHARGRAFAIVTETHVAGEQVWRERSTMLRREGDNGSERRERGGSPDAAPGAEWRLAGDLGRRYAAASGDRNPIHLSAPTAKLFGFSRAIAHGMWTKARCLAALEAQLPDAFTVEVEFRKPILLPARVAFTQVAKGDGVSFAVRDAESGAPHLEGTAS